MPRLIDKRGEVYTTNEGFKVTIVENLQDQVKILFEDNHTQVCYYGDIKGGSVKNLNHKSVYNLGFLGVGNFNTSWNKRKPAKRTWEDMFSRCYDKKFLEKNKTYKDCTVHPDWHNFQVFAKWFEENYVEGFDLDKDILVKGNKIYGPSTCCFVPKEINNLFQSKRNNENNLPTGVKKLGSKFTSSIGAGRVLGTTSYLGMFKTVEEASECYNKEKRKYLLELVNKYKNSLSTKVYKRLVNLQFNET